MTIQPLPERPNLEQLKRQAKDLLHSAQSKDSAALARFRLLPALAAKSDPDLASAPLALHDAQSVVAREHGFVSWNALRERVEELTLRFAEAVEAFVRAATDGRTDRAERLLALHPRIARASFHTALVLADSAAVEVFLAEKPSLATARGGPQDWEPLLYLCHNSLPSGGRDRTEGLVAIARRLVALGADPNSRYPWLHHGVRRPALWGATCVSRSLPLAKLLLEAGANPNDGVTLPLAAGDSDLPTLELLRTHGADMNGPWATDGSPAVYAVMHWAAKADGVRWLLEHGANPNFVFGEGKDTPLHVAARKWDVAMAEMLVRHGADLAVRRADGRTPYAVAELNGNRAVADWLLARGSPSDLSEADRFAAVCSRGDRSAAEAMLAARPELRAEIGPDHYVPFRQAAERGDVQALETMLACGFDPNLGDEIGKTALHAAAHEGWPEAVRTLLAHGASAAACDTEFHASPLVWAANGSMTSRRAGRNYAAVARLLLDAGSPTDWEKSAEPAGGLLEVLEEWRKAR